MGILAGMGLVALTEEGKGLALQLEHGRKSQMLAWW